MGIGLSSTAKIGASVGLTASIMSNPTALWSVLNTIQLIIFLPLNSVPYPKKLKNMSKSLVDYNFFPNVFSYFIEPYCTSKPYKQAYDFGITSSVFFINTGKIIFILIAIVLYLCAFYMCGIFFMSSEKFKRLSLKYKFNVLLRFWIQSYTEIGFFSVIQLKSVI